MRKCILTLVLIVGSISFIRAQEGGEIEWVKKPGPYGGNIETLEIAPDGDLFIIAENSGTIYRSTDDGFNWSAVTKPVNNSAIQDLKIGPDGTLYALSDGGFYVSTNDGASWTKRNTGTSSADGGFDFAFEIEINPKTGDLLLLGYADPNTVVYVSVDGGVIWLIGGILPSSNDKIAVSSFGPSGMIFTWGCCGNSSLYASDDGGFNFIEYEDGINDISFNDMAISPDGENAFVASRDGIYRWDKDDEDADPTVDWINITENLGSFFADGGVLCTATSGTADYLFFGDNSSNTLYRKDLSGANNWTTQNSEFAINGSEAFELAAESHTSIFVAARNIGVFKSTNAGAAWIESNKGIEDQAFNDIIRSGGRIIVAAEQHIYSSTNEGATWSRFDLPGTNDFKSINNFIELSNGDLYGYGSVSVFSDNGGFSWVAAADPFTPDNHVKKIVNSDDTKFFALNFFNNGEIAFSGDAGVNWTPPIPLTISSGNYDIENIYANADHTLFADIRDFDEGGTHYLYKITFSPDPGTGTPTSATATRIDTSTPGFTIEDSNMQTAYANGTIYAFGHDDNFDWQLCFSSDGGTSFSSKALNGGAREFFVAPNGYILIYTSDGSDNHHIAFSRDGGNTFTESTVGNVFKGDIRTVGLDEATGVAYALINYSGLYHTTATVVLPEAPTNLVEVGRGARGLSFRFTDNAENEDEFLIEKETGGVFDTLDVTSGNGGTGGYRYIHERGLQPSTTYKYRVAAVNAAGRSAYVPINITTLAETTPSIPDNRSWTATTSNLSGLGVGSNPVVTIKHLGDGFYSISDVTGGILDNNGVINEDTEIPEFFYEASGQTYLQAFDGPLREQQNGTWDGTTLKLRWRLDVTAGIDYPDVVEEVTFVLNSFDPIPNPPSGVKGLVYSSTEIEVSWTGTSFEEEFVIERATAAAGPFTEIGTVPYPNTSFLDDGSAAPLVLNTTYFYQVKGSNSSGASAASTPSDGILFTIPNFTLSNSAVSTQSLGTGTCFLWADFDNDGDEDAVLVQLTFVQGSSTTPFAFRNDGNGGFTAVDAGFETSDYFVGTAADYDNDGNVDIYMSTTAEENILYKGNGDFTFTRVTPNPAGTPNSGDFDESSISQSWVDYDNNGNLDMFVAPQQGVNQLFSQDPVGTFTLLTTEELVNYTGSANGHAWADYDNDGDMDVYVLDNSQETTPNRLYKNNGDGTFVRVVGLEFDADLDLNGFSCSWGDYDNDGDLDLFLGVQEGSNLVYRNSGSAGNYTFTSVSLPPVTSSKTYSNFGSAWGDIDNDGDLDLLSAGSDFEGGGVSPNSIFLNNGSGAFTEVVNEKFNDESTATFGLSFVDYDEDGFLDVSAATLSLAALQFGGPGANSLLFKNNHTANGSNNWVQFKLVGTVSNRDAIGARVRIVAGGKTQIREVAPLGGFANGSSRIVHFGLGSSASITSIQVRWPSGLVQNYTGKAVNQIHILTEDEAGPDAASLSPANNQTGVHANTAIKITLDEPSTPVAGKFLILYTNSGATVVDGVEVTDAVHTGNEYTFSLPKLESNTLYSVGIDAGAFIDEFGNASLEFPSGLWSFTTAPGPGITTLSPGNAATNIPANTKLSITFNGNIQATPGKIIRLYKFPDLANPVETFNAENGVIAGTRVDFTPASALDIATTYHVSIDAGAFVADPGENDFAGLDSDDWSFTTSSGPQVSTLSPIHNSTNIDANADLVVTFAETVTPIAGKTLKVYKSTDLATAIETLDVASADQSGQEFTFHLTSPLDRATQYSVSIDEGAFVSVAGSNNYSGLAATDWSFTTSAGPQVSTLSPTHNSTNIDANADLVVTFAEDVTPVAGKTLKVYKSTDLATAIETLDVANADQSGQEFTFHLTSPLDRATQYSVSIDEGAFVSVAGSNNYSGLAAADWSFTTSSGPQVSTFSPLDNSTGIDANTDLVVTFAEAVTPIAGKTLRIYKTTDLATVIETLDVANANQSGQVFTFQVTSPLDRATQYDVIIDAGAFVSVAGSNGYSGTIAGAWSFTTSTGPSISGLAPASGATGIQASTNLSVTFSEDVDAVAGKTLKLFKSSDLGTAVQSINATSAAVTGAIATFDVTVQLDPSSTYNVSLDEGAFRSDAGGNATAAILAANWSFTTDPGPTATYSPAHNSPTVPIEEKLVITFSRTVTAVAGKKIRVMSGATALVNSDVATAGTIEDNAFTLNAPSGGWPHLTLLEVIVDAGAFVDGNQNLFAGIAAGTWSFTTVEAPDTAPPSISFTPLATTLEKGFANIPIQVTVTDDRQVVSATFMHRKISEKTFSPLTLTFNTNTQKWEGQVLSSFADDMGFEYYLVAYDGAQEGSLPATANTYFKTSITFDSAPPSFALPAGGTQQSWRIISIPYDLPSTQVSAIFGQLTIDKKTARLIRYNNVPTESWQDFPDAFNSIERGKGYFVNTRQATTIVLDDASAPQFTRDNLFQMELVAGWNQIGNPYSMAIDWQDVIAYNPTVEFGELLKYNGGTYVSNPQLPVLEGGFVHSEATVTIDIPFDGQNIPGGGRKGFSSLGDDIDSDDWALRMNLNQGEISYNVASVGMATEAKPGYDRYDAVTPPRFFEFLEINFAHPEHFSRRFTRDIVPTQEHFTWEFSVASSQPGMAELHWENLPLTNAAKDIFLLDIAHQKLVNMKETGSYLFDPSESATFRVYFGENLNIAPEGVQLGKAYPNPTNGYTVIAFSLPETGGLDQLVSLDLLDAMGRQTGTITQGRLNPGYHEAGFEAKELPSGFYTYRLTVQGINGRTTHVNKLIIK